MSYSWLIMRKISRLGIVTLLLGAFLLTFSPLSGVFAKTGMSTNKASTFGFIGLGALGLGIGASLFGSGAGTVANAPAAITAFGGLITKIVPCTNGGFWMLVAQPPPKQPTIQALIWTPATRTYLWGPPRKVGQWVLGRYDIPYACTQGPHIPALYGFRMTMVGTSAI